jgi:hypothetical protein
MPRWKTSEQILNLSKDGEVFDENWMNYISIYQYMPRPIKWKENRLIKFEDVDIWEVIAEISGPVGIYAAWQPYAPYFVAMKNWSIDQEFWGVYGEKRLHSYMVNHGIHVPINSIWIDEEDVPLYKNEIGGIKMILPGNNGTIQ